MAGAGLQCWDASGRLIVDLGDYMVRYHGSTTIRFTGTGRTVTINYPGVTQNGSFAVITNTNYGSTTIQHQYAITAYCVRCLDGKLTAYYLVGDNAPATTLTVEVYSFI